MENHAIVHGARPAAAVWAFFQDVPAVASCLPGAELVESNNDRVQRGPE